MGVVDHVFDGDWSHDDAIQLHQPVSDVVDNDGRHDGSYVCSNNAGLRRPYWFCKRIKDRVCWGCPRLLSSVGGVCCCYRTGSECTDRVWFAELHGGVPFKFVLLGLVNFCRVVSVYHFEGSMLGTLSIANGAIPGPLASRIWWRHPNGFASWGLLCRVLLGLDGHWFCRRNDGSSLDGRCNADDDIGKAPRFRAVANETFRHCVSDLGNRNPTTIMSKDN